MSGEARRGVEAPKVEVAVHERGFFRETVVEVKTPYGEIIAEVAVSSRRGAGAKFADHDVTFSTRANLVSPPYLEGGTSSPFPCRSQRASRRLFVKGGSREWWCGGRR